METQIVHHAKKKEILKKSSEGNQNPSR